MKRLLLIGLTFFTFQFVEAQQTCVDFNSIQYTMQQINVMQHGSVFHTQGNVILKTSAMPGWPSSSTIIHDMQSKIAFSGYIDIDVADELCATKKLTIEGTFENLAIDHDTLLNVWSYTFPHTGSNYTINKLAMGFEIIGNYNMVKVGGQTSMVTKICLDNSSCNPTSILPNKSASPLKLYPNPNNGEFTLDLGNSNSNIRILNSIGSVVFEQNNVASTQSISLNNLSRGLYFVEIYQNNKRSFVQFQVK